MIQSDGLILREMELDFALRVPDWIKVGTSLLVKSSPQLALSYISEAQAVVLEVSMWQRLYLREFSLLAAIQYGLSALLRRIPRLYTQAEPR